MEVRGKVSVRMKVGVGMRSFGFKALGFELQRKGSEVRADENARNGLCQYHLPTARLAQSVERKALEFVLVGLNPRWVMLTACAV